MVLLRTESVDRTTNVCDKVAAREVVLAEALLEDVKCSDRIVNLQAEKPVIHPSRLVSLPRKVDLPRGSGMCADAGRCGNSVSRLGEALPLQGCRKPHPIHT